MTPQQVSQGGESVEELARRFNYWDPALNDDPHRVLSTLRDACPVARSEELGGYWFISSFEGVRQVLADTTTFSSRALTLPPEAAPELLIPETIDPPEHAKYRRLFTPYFSPRRVEQLRERTRGYAARLAEDFVARGGGDFVADFSVPLPCTVFMEVAGFPIEDLPRLLVWKEAFLRDGVSDDPEKRRWVAEEIMPEMMGYFGQALDEREAMSEPPDDLLTGLLTGELEPGRRMPREEIFNALLLQLAAGLDTVTAALGFSVEYLAGRPEVRRRLREQPTLLPTAVEEFLRYFGLITTCRQANADAVVDGVKIAAGEYVAVCVPSADRDPREFARADEIDIERFPNRHLAFGIGPHRCMGSHLARMEMAVALEEIHRVMPDYVVTPGSVSTRHYGGVMGLDSLMLTPGTA